MVPTEAASRSRASPGNEEEGSPKDPRYLEGARSCSGLAAVESPFPRLHGNAQERFALEIAKVLRDMYRLKFDKDLSFGERRLLDQARSLLVQELALAKKVPPSAMEGEIQQIFSA